MQKNIEIVNICIGEATLEEILLPLLNENSDYTNLLQILIEEILTSEEDISNDGI